MMSLASSCVRRGRRWARRPPPRGLSRWPLLLVWLWALAGGAAEPSPQAGSRSWPLAVPAEGRAGFTAMAAETTGIRFANLLPEARFRTNQILLNGSGVAAGDVDGDGRCDLYFARLNGSNALYRNLGQWRFEEITASAGVACANLDSTGVALVDLDGDGDLDLVVNTLGHGTHLFGNDGQAHFVEWTPPEGLNAGKGGMSLALGDLDGDGFLDLYVANYRTQALMDMPNARFWLKKGPDGKQVVSMFNGRSASDPEVANRFVVTPAGGIEEQGEEDAVYRNLGGTNFATVSFTNGAFLDEEGVRLARPPFEWGLSVIVRDLNQDGLPDLYVCNDFDGPDRFWLNQGGGRFRAVPRLAVRQTSLFAMAVDVADVNRDGFDDIMVLDMLSREHVRRMNFLPDRKPPIPGVGEMENRPQYARNTLELNRGDGTYAEIAALAGLEASEWSWGVVFLDVDLDGWEDVLVTNGHERDARAMDVLDQIKAMRTAGQLGSAEATFAVRQRFPRLATANVAFRNQHDLTFAETGRAWGFDLVGVSQAMALADLDNDGDLDVVIENLNEPATILRNNSSAPRVAVRLRGRAPNTAGIGAQIRVWGGPVTQQQEMMAGGRYLSSDQPLRVFAAGHATNLLTIEVNWRSGRRSVVPGAKANQLYEIAEPGESAPAPGPDRSPPANRRPASGPGQPPTVPRPLFEEVSARLNHQHAEEPFDDSARQPLLPRKLSQLGPGVSWCDLDGDGWDDVVVGSGKGGALGVFRNNGQGGFARLETPPFNQPAARDQTTVLAWPGAPGQLVLLAGSANYEEGASEGSCVVEYDGTAQSLRSRLPALAASTGPLALADIDGDGDLDLFVGGRVVAGKYPAPASSALFRNVAGNWELDVANTAQYNGLGLVSGAVFSDLDGDGLPELVLACEWGPVRVLRNRGGRFTDATVELGLASFTGWWNGVATGDFDGDGRLDIVASNWGRNTRYEAARAQPLRLYHGDLGGDGATHLIEAHHEAALDKFVPWRRLDVLARTLPFVQARFPTRAAYGQASVAEILGERFAGASLLEAAWLESTVFLNRGTNFIARPLPLLAQAAPAFGVAVGDCDGDGREDIFLAQNFFAVQVEMPRLDAGVGLWLRGDGHGGFTPLRPDESGVRIYGEQRGAALADYDHDGRVDLLVGQNARATKLFHNVGGRPGLRVRLTGPPGNPQAIGALLRLGGPAGWGSAREVQAGSGYWSLNSAVQVMSPVEGATQLTVRWPGGKMTTQPLPLQAREVTVSPAGLSRSW